MSDIRNFIKIADAFGKEASNLAKLKEDWLDDAIADRLGIQQDNQDTSWDANSPEWNPNIEKPAPGTAVGEMSPEAQAEAMRILGVQQRAAAEQREAEARAAEQDAARREAEAAAEEARRAEEEAARIQREIEKAESQAELARAAEEAARAIAQADASDPRGRDQIPADRPRDGGNPGGTSLSPELDDIRKNAGLPPAQQGTDGAADAAASQTDANDPRGDQTNPPSATPRDGGNPGGTTTAVDPDANDPRGDQTNPPANQQGIDGPADAAAAQQGTDGAADAAAGAGDSAADVARDDEQRRRDAEGEGGAAQGGDALAGRLDTQTPSLLDAYNNGGRQAMDSVRDLQTGLSRLGFDPNGIDGKYGQGTYSAVQEFQRQNGLQVDGEAGPETMAKLQELLNADSTPQQGDSAADVAQDDAARQTDATQAGEAPGAQDQEDPGLDAFGGAGPDVSQAGEAPGAQDQEDPGLDAFGGAGPDVSQAASGAGGATLQADIRRIQELLSKFEPTGTGPTLNASVDFRHLIALVENAGKLTEALSAAELDELQGFVDKYKDDPNFDQALMRRMQGTLRASGRGTGDSAADVAQDDAARADGVSQAASGAGDSAAAQNSSNVPDDGNRAGQTPNNLGPDGQRDGDDLGNAPTSEKPTLDSLAQQIKKGVKFNQFEKIVKDAEALEPEDAAQDANFLQKLGRKAQQLLSTAEYRSRYVIAKGAENLQIDGLYRPDGSNFIFMQNGEPSGSKMANLNQAMQVAQVGLLPPSKVEQFKKQAEKNPKFQNIIAAHERATGTTSGTQPSGEDQVMQQDVVPSQEFRIQSNGNRVNVNIASARSLPYVDTVEGGKRTRTYGDVAQLQKQFPGKPIGGQTATPAAPARGTQSGAPDAERDGRERGVQIASKDLTMKKYIKENRELDECGTMPPSPMSQGSPVSMNVTLNASGEQHVQDLIRMMQLAGAKDAASVADMHVGPVDKHDDMVAMMQMMDQPEESVEEDWDNSPNEDYRDHKYMTKDLSGGLNREKKAYAKAQDGDNPMAVENIKSQLLKALEESGYNKK
jgi:peptidoglycan hydrolase-like protein with peptidoglycan-binding domain